MSDHTQDSDKEKHNMITIQIVGTEKVVSNLLAMTPKLRTTLKRTMRLNVTNLLRLIKEDYLSGRALHVRTGRLRRSVHSEIQEGPSGMIGAIGTDVSYGKFHEYGFTRGANVRERLAKLKDASRQRMLFGGGGIRGQLAKAKANAASGEFPEHAFLRPALEELAPSIQYHFEEALRRGIQGQ